MAHTRLSLRAAISFAFFTIGEASSQNVKHRRGGRCRPSQTLSSDSLTLTSTVASSSTLETIVILSSISAESATSIAPPASVSTAEETTTTASSVEDTTTSAEPTSASSVASTSVGPTTTSEVIITPSAPSCEPTSTWAPELCWRSIPVQCGSMTITTALASAYTARINACSTSLRGYDGQLAREVSGCFDNIGQAAFDPTSAYSCVSSAPIYCQTTSACAPSATSTPIIPPYDNPSFESGALGSWTEVPPTTPGNLLGSISTEQAHTGQYSLKLQSNNAANDYIAWTHRVRFEPGARYEFSFWYYSVNQARGTLSLRVDYPGTSIPLVVQMATQMTGKWTQQRFTLTPFASFGTVSVTYTAVQGSVGNVVYVDDVTVTKTS